MTHHCYMLSLIVPRVIAEIMKRDSLSEIAATDDFYSSKTYSLLERRETGVWHYSSRCLYEIYKSEKNLTGNEVIQLFKKYKVREYIYSFL